MIIRMSDGTNEIEWRVAGTIAIQFDKVANHYMSFNSYDEACVWVIDQVNYVRNDMGYKFIK